MKRCTKCKLEFDESNFYKSTIMKDGLHCLCKACLRISAKKSAEKHKERINEKGRQRYWANPEKYRKASRDYAKSHPEWARKVSAERRGKNPEVTRAADKRKYEKHKSRIIAYQKEYAAKNRDKRNAIARAWAARNKENRQFHTNQRRAARVRATVPWANLEYVRLFYVLAKAETERTGKKCHVDHIVPLKSPLVCGLHHEHNLQISFYDDNIRKGNRWWPDMPEASAVAHTRIPAYAKLGLSRAVT